MLSPLPSETTYPTRSWNGLPEGYKFEPFIDLEHPWDRTDYENPWGPQVMISNRSTIHARMPLRACRERRLSSSLRVLLAATCQLICIARCPAPPSSLLAYPLLRRESGDPTSGRPAPGRAAPRTVPAMPCHAPAAPPPRAGGRRVSKPRIVS